MQFPKGQSGNPLGRPKGSKTRFSLVDLEKAIKQVEKEKQVSLYKHFVERALLNDNVLIALVKKLIPDTRFMGEKDECPWLNHEIEIISPSENTEERLEKLKEFLN